MSAAPRLDDARWDEARRWTKFPATLLIITGVLWLIEVLFKVAQDWNGNIAQPSETFVGAVVVFALAVVVPLGSPLAGVFILYLHRKALYVGAALPFIPLAYLTWYECLRIARKFHEYRTDHAVASFGTAVMEAVILLGLWSIVWVHLLYIRRALRELASASRAPAAWVPATAPAGFAPGGSSTSRPAADDPDADLDDGDEVQFMMPDDRD